VDATQGWVPPAQTVQWPDPQAAPVEHDPALGWGVVDESQRIPAGDPRGRPFGLDEHASAGTPQDSHSVVVRVGPQGGAPASATAAPAPAAATAAKAVATARVIGETVVREAKRYDHTVATRWPKRRWLIHGATGVAALVLLAIPLSAASAPASGQGPTGGAATPVPTVAVGNQIRIDDPENGSRTPTDRVMFRGIGPVGATVVQDVPLADDPKTTIGPDGTWALEVALGPGENLITLRLGDDRATSVTWTVTSTLSAATPTPEPTPVPRLVDGTGPTFPTISLKGTGDSVVDIDIPQDAVAIAGIVHKGKGTFRVTALDANAQPTQVLVDHTGTYRGTRLFDLVQHSTTLQVEANGAWTITIKPVGGAKVWDGVTPITGKGSSVARLATPAGPSTAATVRHPGGGTFVLVAHLIDGPEALLEVTGPYDGPLVIPEGTLMFEVVTLDEWSIVFG
jgi:hypothetical protein